MSLGSAISARMVGRATELEVLRTALAAGRAGSPRAVVVRGEAGIGKTRLLRELIAEATAPARPPSPSAPPLVTATGQCVDLGPIGAAFTPIRRLLHELYRAVGDDAFRAAAGSPIVVTTLSSLVPEIAAEAPAPAGGADYVTEAIERVVENLSADHHLLLVIEDLHWADAATLALLKTLATTLRGAHLTLVMTYRSDDVGRGHPLRPVLAELERSRLVTGIAVERLAPDEVAAQAEELLGRAPTADELRALAGRSEGVPFFVEELVGHGDADLPETLRDVVLARYEALSPAARRVARLLAAGGVHVEHDTLAAVHRAEPGDLDDGIREAMTANVIVPDESGYTFRHALIQEAVHDELLPSERVDLHTRYALELQRRADAGAPALSAAIAEHWLVARDNARAFDATVRALTEARETYALTAAALLGERLLELWPQVPDAAVRAGRERQVLALSIAENLADAGDTARSARVVEEALALCPPEDPLTRATLMRLLFIHRHNLGHRGPDQRALLDDAEAIVAGDDSSAARALLARILGAKGVYALGGEDGLAMLDEAVERAVESGDVDALASVVITRASSRADLGDLEGALEDLRRGSEVTTIAGFTYQAINNMVDVLVRLGRLGEAVALGETGREQADAVGLERGNGSYIETNLSEALLALGRATEAVPRLRRCLALLHGDLYFRSFALRLLAAHAVWDDRLDEADAVRENEAAFIAQACVEEDERLGWTLLVVDSALARRESETDPARRATWTLTALEHAAVLAEESVIGVPGLSARVLPAAARTLAAARADGVDDPRLALVAEQIATAQTTPPGNAHSAALAALTRAELTGAAPIGPDPAGTSSDRADAWRAAVAELAGGAAPCWHLHHARYRLAQTLIERGERDEAVTLLDTVIAAAPGDGVAIVARWARELAGRAGLAIRDAGTPAPHSPAGSPLTPRELQVLALVAEGLTNPQIGQRLFISPKTASVHVSAILTKVGAANRAEAAALYSAQASQPAQTS